MKTNLITKWGVYEIPTKQARIFAGAKNVLIAEFDNQDEALKHAVNQRMCGYYDECIDTFSCLPIFK